MKVESVVIRNFKRFDCLEISLTSEALRKASERFLVLGDNGSGKTTLLQAIALPLALATRQIASVSEFDWIGFLPARFSRWGKPHIELTVTFTPEEIDKTQLVAEQWYEAQSESFRSAHDYVPPGDSRSVRLVLHGEHCRAGSAGELYQFRGRYYARRLLQTDPSVRRHFPELPGVFWFDQFRNLGSALHAFDGDGQEPQESGGRISYEFGVGRLRRYLNGWQLAQQSRTRGPYQVKFLMLLQNHYKRVFPGRSFAGVEPMPGIDAPTAEDFYFLLNDGHRDYDIVEMSAGEQAVFPLLYEFVRQQIGHSLVLVDEIDLNLHPPAAQQLVRQLPHIGPDCQFIFTTHSEAVSDIVGEEHTHRLPGGTLCL